VFGVITFLFTWRVAEQLLDPLTSPGWTTVLCGLFDTSFSIHSHLPRTPGGLLLCTQTEDAPCHNNRHQ